MSRKRRWPRNVLVHTLRKREREEKNDDPFTVFSKGLSLEDLFWMERKRNEVESFLQFNPCIYLTIHQHTDVHKKIGKRKVTNQREMFHSIPTLHVWAVKKRRMRMDANEEWIEKEVDWWQRNFLHSSFSIERRRRNVEECNSLFLIRPLPSLTPFNTRFLFLSCNYHLIFLLLLLFSIFVRLHF